MILDIQGEKITLVIEKKKNKNLYLRFKEDGILYCNAPYRMNEEEIMKFIHSKEKWILSSKKKIEKKKNIHSEVGNKEIYIFGKKKDLIVVESGRARVMENETALFLFSPTDNEEYLEKLFRKYASAKINELISLYRNEWDEKICKKNHISLPDIKVRYMTSKWGVCYPTRCSITMSSRLIHYPVDAFRYVLLHEYVHFLVQNHSKKFYDYVEHFMPEYKVYNSYLR